MDDFNFNFDDDEMAFPGLDLEEGSDSMDFGGLSTPSDGSGGMMGSLNFMDTMDSGNSFNFEMGNEPNNPMNSALDTPNSKSDVSPMVGKETESVSKLEKMLANLDFKKAGFLVGGCILVFSLILAGVNKMIDKSQKAPKPSSTYVEEQAPVQQQQPVQQQSGSSGLLLTTIDESSLHKYNPQSYELDVSLKKKQITLVQNTLYYTYIFDIMGTDVLYYVSENSYRKVNAGETLHLKYTTYTTNNGGFYYQITSVSTP